MAGGMGRALSPYDEMVFRTMVRDGAYLYDVVGLEAEGTTVDFQVGQNAYLYGTRFMNYLAYQHGPEAPGVGEAERRGPRGLLRQPVHAGLRRRHSTTSGGHGSRGRRSGRRRISIQVRQVPASTAVRPISRVRSGRSRARSSDRRTNRLFAGGELSREVPSHCPRSTSGPASSTTSAELKGAALYYVASLAYDETGGAALLHHRQQQLARPPRARSRHRQRRTLMKDERTGDLA